MSERRITFDGTGLLVLDRNEPWRQSITSSTGDLSGLTLSNWRCFSTIGWRAKIACTFRAIAFIWTLPNKEGER